jgi:hypothetical protein
LITHEYIVAGDEAAEITQAGTRFLEIPDPAKAFEAVKAKAQWARKITVLSGSRSWIT